MSQQDKVLLLAIYQRELRIAVAKKMKDDAITIAKLSDHVKTGWTELRDFLNCERAICVDRVVTNLCKYAEIEHLSTKILNAAKDLSMKVQGISVLTVNIINLIFLVQTEFQKHCDSLTIKTFALIFVGYEKVVMNILQFNKKLLQNLDDVCIAKISEVVESDNFSEMCKIAQTSKAHNNSRKATELEKLVAQLQSCFNTTDELANKLGYSKSALKSALKGDVTVGDETYNTMILKAKKLLKINNNGIEKQVSQTMTPNDGSVNRLNSLAGSTSKLGVKYILGPDDFNKIKLQSTLDEAQIAELAKSALERARALLNICTQIKDKKVREKIVNSLGPEVEEMHLAIRLFTSENPNGLSGIFLGQRETWFGDGSKRFQQNRKEGL